MQLINYQNYKPKLASNVFIGQGAKIIGNVEIGSLSSIWFNSTLRGDVAPIKIGSGSNIQDNSVIHTSRFNNGSVHIGNNVTVGHMALIHACRIMDNSFIGMRAVVMDGSIVEEFGFVAAGALVTERKIVKSYELWAGMPAKFVRKLTDREINFMKDNASNYISLAQNYLNNNKKVDCPAS